MLRRNFLKLIGAMPLVGLVPNTAKASLPEQAKGQHKDFAYELMWQIKELELSGQIPYCVYVNQKGLDWLKSQICYPTQEPILWFSGISVQCISFLENDKPRGIVWPRERTMGTFFIQNPREIKRVCEANIDTTKWPEPPEGKGTLKRYFEETERYYRKFLKDMPTVH